MKYRKKPIVIEAVQVRAADYNPAAPDPFDSSQFSETPGWLLASLNSGEVSIHESSRDTDYAVWQIKTLEDGENGEAVHIASPGDYIIRGVQGELYFCKPDIFEMSYEVAE